MSDLNDLMKTDPEQGVRLLLNRYGGLAYFAVRRVLHGCPEDDIEECVSDVFLYVYRHRKRLDFTDEHFRAYLFRTAEHKALDRLKKLARLPVPQSDALWDADASERSAEELALAEMSRDELIERIRALGEPDATILIAKYWLGMRSDEIAELLGMKANTVVQRAGRALKRLKATWKGEETNG